MQEFEDYINRLKQENQKLKEEFERMVEEVPRRFREHCTSQAKEFGFEIDFDAPREFKLPPFSGERQAKGKDQNLPSYVPLFSEMTNPFFSQEEREKAFGGLKELLKVRPQALRGVDNTQERISWIKTATNEFFSQSEKDNAKRVLQMLEELSEFVKPSTPASRSKILKEIEKQEEYWVDRLGNPFLIDELPQATWVLDLLAEQKAILKKEEEKTSS